jgi:hypothetical protein
MKQVTIRFYWRTIFLSACILLALPASVYAQETVDSVTVAIAPTEEEESTDSETKTTAFQPLQEKNPITSSSRQVSQQTYHEIKDDDAFWYANGVASDGKTKATTPTGQKGTSGSTNKPPKVKEQKNNVHTEEEEQPNYTSMRKRSWFNIIMWVLAIAGIAAIIGWYLVSSKVGLFRKKDVKVKEEEMATDMPADIFAIHYKDEVEKAEEAGNYRLAIRLQYLRLLKSLAEKNWITYQQDKTNFDYLTALYNTIWYTDFFRITRTYEFSWYGKFDVSEAVYKQIKQHFMAIQQKLAS